MDVIAVGAAAVVLLALPLVVDEANVFAGLGGAAVGGLAGLVASFGVARGEAE
jgi:hypothetical protein